MKRLCFYLVISLVSLSFAQNDETERSTDGEKINKFVSEAARGSMMEIELGKMAQSKGESPEIKEFGRMMEEDHGKANDKLEDIADENNIMMPDKMTAKHQAKIDDLRNLEGSEFDKQYISMMIKDHQEDIRKFEQAVSSNENSDIKKWAKETLPTLRQHLKDAQVVQRTLDKLSGK